MALIFGFALLSHHCRRLIAKLCELQISLAIFAVLIVGMR